MRLTVLLLATLLWGCAPDAPETSAPVGATPPESAAPADATPPEPAAAATGSPVISDAWIRRVPPAAHMTAGYLSISNPGAEPLVIVGVESPAFGSVELHGTIMTDGVARMREQEAVTVAPGDTVRFEPGGLHLMLMQPTDGVPTSGTVPMTLLLEDGERIEFDAPVGSPGG
ncbi:copper chaperone PCu(A)C [Wenzhouxiangella sp. XN24]|uniref:copper chaperone PCu(A)C n=1 Tax=Wenzhouxiangella sp. XN24 TaxID=2713569 RepID=UPI0013EAA095|nr:copper chaperone PCu(A)C [Wenzhouxiangella sp. XN24]NGX16945.1 copper chaperone PCu(A)C [Wenzhouxiangella sp. XN24]